MLLLASAAGAQQPFRFHLRADPSAIAADGHSTATISVEVNSAPGDTVVEGTEVRFVTTLGVITESSRLLNGTARATLRSGTLAGVATVTALIGVSREQLEVQFLPVGTAGSRVSRLIQVSGDSVAYSVDRNMIIVSGRGTLRVQELTLQADVKMSIHVRQQRLLAEGKPGNNGVSLSNGVDMIRGDQLTWDIRARRGILSRVTPTPGRYLIHAEDLTTETPATTADVSWIPVSTAGTQTWIICRRLTVFPEKKIQFHHAAIYLNEVHVVTLPIHVLSLSSVSRGQALNGLFGDRSIGFNSTGGFNLDVPFYYRANAKGTGAVRLRRSAGSGFSTEQPGWSLALEEQYALSDQGEGVVTLDQLPRKEWGLSLQHEQRFAADERGFLYLDFPRHRDLFGRLSYYKRQPTFNFGMELYGTLPKNGYGYGSSQLYWQMDPKPIRGTPLTYTLTGDLSLSRNMFGPGVTRFSQGVDFRVYPRPLLLGGKTSLVSSVKVGAYHDTTNRFAASLGGSLSLRRSLGRTGALTLGYTYDPGSLTYETAGANRYLSLGLYASRGWRTFLSVYGTRSLSEDSVFAFGSFAYRITRNWQTSLDVSHQGFFGTTYTDYDFTLGRTLGNLEARMVYSKSRHRVYLELGAAMY